MNKRVIGAIIFIALMLGASVAFYFTVNYPADAAYNRKLGTYVTVATQSGSLQKSWDSINTFKANMYEVFPKDKFDYNNTFNVIPIFGLEGDLIWENSLGAQEDYFISIDQRMGQDIDRVLGNVSVIGVTQQSLLYDLRNELNSYGGMDWVVRPAFYIHYHPMAYWSAWYYALFALIALIGTPIILFVGRKEDSSF